MSAQPAATTTPATRKEEALWLLERFTPGTGVNNLSVTIQVDGRLRPELVATALTRVVVGFETLSTVFHATASPEPGAALLTKRVLDPAEVTVGLEERELDGPLDETVGDWIAAPFPIDGGLLVRGLLVHATGGDVLCVAVHHLVFDTISQGVLVGEFATAYDALLTDADTAADGTRVPATVEAAPSERSRRFWRTALADFDAVNPELAIGVDAAASTDLQGAVVVRPLAPEVADAVRTLQERFRASEAVVLLAGYYALLARHGAGPDLVVGTPVNSRPREAPGAIGYHINVVPLRTTIDLEAGFDVLLKKTRSVFLNSISHADVPVDSLLDEVSRTGSGWRNTLFRHVFNYVPTESAPALDFGGAPARLLGIENGCSKFDLELFVLPSDDGIVVRTAFHREAFTVEDVELLMERYEALLLAAVADPSCAVGDLPLAGPTDRAVIDAANDTHRGAAPSVLAEFLARVAEAPDAVAVLDTARGADRSVSYAALFGAAIRNRAALLAAGVTPGDTVVVAGARSAELAAAALGVWLTGGRYLPVDPGHPTARIQYVVEDSGAIVVLRAPGLELPVGEDVDLLEWAAADDAPAHPSELAAARAAVPAELAYQMYTSGSTGKPKGTLLTHGNLDNLIAAFRADLDLAPGTGLLWSTTFTFDISTLELFAPLAAGGRVVVAADADRHDGARLADLVTRHDARVLQATPTAWRIVVDAVAPALAGRTVLCGGEPMPAELAGRLVASGAHVLNVYGPTETCIWSTAGPVVADDPAGVTVGTPLRNTVAFVADARGQQLPLRVPGELCIAGDGVCAGYHERPELTAERFGVHADLGRFYRTGDRARWLADGRLQVLGRNDRQIKLRGVRIELGEIEAVLTAHPGARNSAVVVIGDPSSDGELVAFVERHPGADVDADALWQHAKQSLPLAMTPSTFHLYDELPTNAANKVDYPTLTAEANRRRAEDAVRAVVVTQTGADKSLVSVLVPIFAQVLGRADVTPETNFFAYGGHSLLAVMLVQTIADELGHEVALTDVFATPTPAGVAGLITIPTG